MTATCSLERETLEALEARIRTILPEEYQDRYEDVEPVSMGSAGLKFAHNGKVAWNQIWTTFCDLAMAGGPPHKGTFLEPGSPLEIAVHSERYQEVVEELCRGIVMATGLPAQPSGTAGWIRVECGTLGMAEWLMRATVMENISARCDGTGLELPAGPHYRVGKEIKNVITAIAKTSHYWQGHMSPGQHYVIASLFAAMEVTQPLLQPSRTTDDLFRVRIAEKIQQATGLRTSNHRYSGWMGLDCGEVRAAIWIMRALVASNLLSRREGTVLCVPLDSEIDANGEALAERVTRVHRFAEARGII